MASAHFGLRRYCLYALPVRRMGKKVTRNQLGRRPFPHQRFPGPYWVPGFFVRLPLSFAPEGIFMIRFLAWLRSILMAVVNGLAKAVVLVLLVAALFVVVSLARGDGLAGNMVLALDLREPIDDSAAAPTSIFTPRRATVMDVVLGLDAAGRDRRVK